MRLPHHHHNNSEAIAAHMPDRDNFHTVSSFFRQLGDPNRIRILWLLCHTEECVINIAAIMGMSSPATIHHLKLLREAGLVESRREGKEVYYRAAQAEEANALHYMIEEMMKISCPDVREDEMHIALHSRPHDHEEHMHNDGSPVLSIHGHDHRINAEEHLPAPEYSELVHAAHDNTELIEQVHELLTKDLRIHYPVEELSKIFHINTTTLKEEFRRTYGRPIATYMRTLRMQTAAEYLSSTSLGIGEIAEAVGYSSHSKFTAVFKKYSGMLPKAYRSKNNSMSE